jgi:hypothetical protein
MFELFSVSISTREAEAMSLACRFCHPDPVRTTWKASYATVISYGSNESVAQEVARIEGLRRVIAGQCVLCEECHKYSLISYALACHLHGDDVEWNAAAHYARICTLSKMFAECTQKTVVDAETDDELCDELENACEEE